MELNGTPLLSPSCESENFNDMPSPLPNDWYLTI
eukprot:CAMPEP_0198526550 /NCGR_PEP_ID=MMETSP1462-20131121/24027_1 /TAXON_ID=1333877 /ORGANISM="Brandtodinium nutriculum, Strain RCC3387" /LENGTH=33 /DNA_ID= /DNA_START= /DNA_END= /DNA_ORIENTATION=